MNSIWKNVRKLWISKEIHERKLIELEEKVEYLERFNDRLISALKQYRIYVELSDLYDDDNE